MSFASTIKDSLCTIPVENECCRLSQLVALVGFAGTYSAERLKIKTENENVALCVSQMLCDITPSDSISYKMPKTKSGIHIVTLSGDDATLVAKKLFISDENGNIPSFEQEDIIKGQCCKMAFLRGAFLGGGSMSDPSKNYHAEFVTKNARLADFVAAILLSEDISAKITVRKNSFVIYIKDSEAIANLLGLMGAGMSMMEFYNIKIEREVRNNVNRQVNCDSANVDKITAAASKQLEAIRKIKATIGFESLPETLVEIATLREQNPEMSLKELGTLLSPPIGKSGVNHRLERICEIADNL